MKKITLAIIPKKDSTRISEHLLSDEVKCKCSYRTCTRTMINIRTIDSFEKLRDLYGKVIFITSGFRCTTHNTDVVGRFGSYHKIGCALDLAPEDIVDLDLLEELANNCFDVVIRYASFIHCHNREIEDEIR